MIIKNRMTGEQFVGAFYRPQTKLRGGSVFTPVCHSVHGGLPSHDAMGKADVHPPEKADPPRIRILL